MYSLFFVLLVFVFSIMLDIIITTSFITTSINNTFGNFSVNTTHVTASGNISASGNLIANNINGIIDGGSF